MNKKHKITSLLEQITVGLFWTKNKPLIKLTLLSIFQKK